MVHKELSGCEQTNSTSRCTEYEGEIRTRVGALADSAHGGQIVADSATVFAIRGRHGDILSKSGISRPQVSQKYGCGGSVLLIECPHFHRLLWHLRSNCWNCLKSLWACFHSSKVTTWKADGATSPGSFAETDGKEGATGYFEAVRLSSSSPVRNEVRPLYRDVGSDCQSLYNR